MLNVCPKSALNEILISFNCYVRLLTFGMRLLEKYEPKSCYLVPEDLHMLSFPPKCAWNEIWMGFECSAVLSATYTFCKGEICPFKLMIILNYGANIT